VLRARDGGARFDHRKLVVVDGQVAWTGGRNFREGAFGKQHDVSITISGPLARKFCREFERAWKEHGGQTAAGADGAAPSAPTANAQARLIGTGPLRHDLADALLCAIDHARHHVYLENPYLCDGRLLLRLMAARRRGVDVRVVLTLGASEAIANHANRVTANFLLRAGVRVYLYEGPTHLKALSVDGAWAYLGTGNFDPLSLRHDYEVGLALGDGPLVRQVEEQLLEPDFLPDWELHEPLPVTTVDRLSEVLAALFG
jgi:cardiolipin synthase